ncbi:50S ribosomal protein L7/L12 [Candidatus Endolissoclinum faulkneri]|nr:50S ribosomal protein L7/L12 [Candidatus Endolissoclinum faulkneri]
MSDLAKLVDDLSSLTVLEAAELSKILEEKWHVTAAAPIGITATVTDSASTPAIEEKNEFDVILSVAGTKKINVIKEIRAITGLGLKDAKDLVEGAPQLIKDAVSGEEAQKIKNKLEEAGAVIEIK